MKTIGKFLLLCLCASTVHSWYTSSCWYYGWPYCTSTFSPEPTTPDCVWDSWTECSATCGPSGTQTSECKLGDTVVRTNERECNRVCVNNGTLANGYCSCPLEFTGNCCELSAEGGVELSHGVAGSEVLFHCDYDHDTASQSVSLQFEWYVGNEIVFDEIVNGASARSTMKQANWEGKMGSQIRCEVLIFENNISIGRKRSTSFFAGIEVQNDIDFIEVYENDDSVSIELVPTVPFLCSAPNCVVQIPVTITERSGQYGKYVDAVVQDQCGVFMTSDNPDGTYTIRVKARRDFFSDGDGEVQLEFQPIQTQQAPLWNNYQIPRTITIRTYDRDRWSRKCSSTGDPHYYTMDGMYFHVYLPGEYIFYRHSVLPYEVQTRLKPCWSVACNCGVAARAEDDVIIVDRCKTITEEVVSYNSRGQRSSYFREHRQLTVKIIANGVMTPGFRLVKQDSGRTFKIYFPTGAYVEIQGTTYLSVYFSAGADDYGGENLGLCGSYDTNPENDFLNGPVTAPSKFYSPALRNTVAHDFATTWRVPPGKNLFYGELDTFEKNNVSQVYCTCSPNAQDGRLDEVCEIGKDNGRWPQSDGTCNARVCDVTDEYLEIEVANRRRRSANKRQKRETTVPDDDLVFEFDENFEFLVPEWPTTSGITEAQAQNECFQQIKNTPIGQSCSTALDDDEVEEFIAACKIDIQVLDDLSQAKISRDLLTAQCEEVLSKNSSLWEASSDGTVGPPRSILGAMCPSDCSGNGDCNDGVCTCYQSFGGTDCSTNLNEPPQIYRSGKAGLCDSGVESCTYVSIYGDNFVESADLTCHVTRVEISESEFTISDTTTNTVGEYSTFEEVKCPIVANSRRRRAANAPEPVGALVSISNNGAIESAQVLAIIYDSNCDVCNGTYGYCSRKTDICIVDGECYNLDDPMCQQGSNTWIIVGAVLGSVFAVAIVIIIVAVVCVKKKGKKKSRVDSADRVAGNGERGP